MRGKTRKNAPINGLEMGIIRSQGKALELGSQYIRHSTRGFVSEPIEGVYKFPQQGAPFEVSEKALNNTLKYIYETLKHPCYMLCLSAKNRHFYKLEQTETAPIFKRMVEQEYERVKDNLKPTDREHIERVIHEPFRVMQCIVKPQSKDTFSQEYLNWIGELSNSLPFGVFIFNLTDAVILRKDGKMPFPKPIEPPTPIQTPLLPIFSTSGQQGYWDIPIPTYDDIKHDTAIQWNTDWDTKKEVAVFRGGPTGCGTRADTNSRLAVAKMKSPLLDAGVVSGESRSIRFDPKHGLSMLSMEGITPVGRLSMEQQSDHKYIIHIDGNVLAYRLLTTMLSGSLILRIKSPYVSWIDHYLFPNQHYIEVEEPKDLLKKIAWCKENDEICQRIALRSKELATRVLSPHFLKDYFTKLVWNSIIPKSTECLPWERPPRRFLSVQKPQPFRPNGNPVAPPIKKAKKTTRKKRQKSPSPIQQGVVEPVVSESPKPPPVVEPPDFYMKKDEKEKCRKGFSTDKKNKMRCVASVPKQKNAKNPEPIVEEEQQGVIEPTVAEPANISFTVEEKTTEAQSPVVQSGVLEPYMKQNEKEKCRKGYLTDRKNKLRCVPK